MYELLKNEMKHRLIIRASLDMQPMKNSEKKRSEATDNRKYFRFKRALPAILTFEVHPAQAITETQVMAYTSDISSGGVFVETEHDICEGENLTIQCLLPPDDENALRAERPFLSLFQAHGTVVRKTPKGVAVLFSSPYEMLPVA